MNSDLQTYRIHCADIGEGNRHTAVAGIRGYASGIGVDVVPDSRLQAIADAWKAINQPTELPIPDERFTELRALLMALAEC